MHFILFALDLKCGHVSVRHDRLHEVVTLSHLLNHFKDACMHD